MQARLSISDGQGKRRPIKDLRFQRARWLIDQTIPSRESDEWMAHLHAEAQERGWSSSGLSQVETCENSGTLILHTHSGQPTPRIEIIWKKRRNSDLHLRARTSSGIMLQEAREFFDAIGKRARRRVTARGRRRDLLAYDGLPWRGTLWLGGELCLRPPSRFPEALTGPQIVIVDAMVNGIGQVGVTAEFRRRVWELRCFLAATTGICTGLVRPELGWVAEFDTRQRPIDCALRSVGYWEVAESGSFPVLGSSRPVPRKRIKRPGLGPSGISSDDSEQWMPSDIEDLWHTFLELPEVSRSIFLRASNAYLIADAMWPDQRTAYASFLVIACEALKHGSKKHDKKNAYWVIAGLLGPAVAERLHGLEPSPQDVRSSFVHRAGLLAGEPSNLFYNRFADPSFDEMLREFHRVCRQCLTEWLRRGGKYEMTRPSWIPKHTRRKRARPSA